MVNCLPSRSFRKTLVCSPSPLKGIQEINCRNRSCVPIPNKKSTIHQLIYDCSMVDRLILSKKKELVFCTPSNDHSIVAKSLRKIYFEQNLKRRMESQSHLFD